MKTYLVTGVAGFIGSAISRKLLENGHKVVGIDNFSTGFHHNIPDDVEFFEVDISEANQLKTLNNFTFNAVLHLAAQTSGEISFDDPPKDLLINALGTLNLLEYCKDHKINRFLYASSMAVYGDVEDKPISISQHTNPKSYYGITKLAGEQYVQAFSDRIKTTSFRIFNVYGPGQNMQNIKQGMISIYLYYFMKNQPVLVKGSKDRFRDFVYIDDVVSAWIKAIDEPKAYGVRYNLGSGVKTTVEELLTLIAQEWGGPEHLIKYVEGTPKDMFEIQANIDPIMDELDWKPETNIKKGLSQFIKWVKGITK